MGVRCCPRNEWNGELVAEPGTELLGALLGVPKGVLPAENTIFSLKDEVSTVLDLLDSLMLFGKIQSLSSRFNDGENVKVGILGRA